MNVDRPRYRLGFIGIRVVSTRSRGVGFQSIKLQRELVKRGMRGPFHIFLIIKRTM